MSATQAIRAWNSNAGITFLDEGESEPKLAGNVTEEFADILVRAVEVSTAVHEDKFALSFGSLLASFGLPRDRSRFPISSWAFQFAAQTGTRLLRDIYSSPSLKLLTERDADVKILGRPLTRTASARRALDEAREISKRACGGKENMSLDASHLLGALLWLSDYHVSDFKQMGLLHHIWRPAFVDEVARHRPDEAEFWRGLVNATTGHAGSETGEEESQEGEGQDRSKVVEYGRRACLLTWDPSRFQYDQFADEARKVSESGIAKMSWSAGLTHRVLVGDRVFLMRHGPNRPGLVGSGRVVGEPVEARHWDETKPSTWRTNFVDVEWDVLGEFPLVSLKELKERTQEQKLWTANGSGFLIPTSIAESLEILWHEGVKRRRAGAQGLEGFKRPRGPLIPSYDPDAPSGRAEDDCLDHGATVNAMASLIASPELDGALSLGVFGNWGSGKSFFMARLRATIDDVTKRATPDVLPDGAPSYWPNVAQVEFNAWHYVDANLWASLMSHLLEALRRWKPTSGAQGVQSGLARAIEQLEITSAAREEARKREQAAINAMESANTAFESAQQSFNTATKRLGEALARSLWAFVEGKVAGEKKVAIDALRKLELVAKDAEISTEKVYAELRRLTSTAGHINAILHQVLRNKRGGCWLMWLGVGVSVAIIGIVVGSRWADWLRNASAVLGTSLAGFIVIATQTVTWVQKQSVNVLDKIAPLMAVRASFDAKLAEAEQEKSGLVASEQQKVANCEAELSVATQTVVAREREVQEAKLAVSDAVSGRAVRQFIEQRLATGEYQKHLGLIATIRRDFERLSELIQGHNACRLSLHEEVERIENALRCAQPDIDAQQIKGLIADMGLNRIVLYIDDLDRCPSSRVVEVLQAIHLLLSFPIFAVVVGVDARWMTQSLALEYPSLLTQGANRDKLSRDLSRERQFSVVTPADYLEKIFQIPLWVPPLNATSTRTLIGKLTTPMTVPTLAAPEESYKASDAMGSPAGSDKQSAIEQRHASEVLPTSAATPVGDDGIDTHAETVKPDAPLRPELLRVHEDERIAMQSLAVIIGRSPRATKRFINSYRLLKAALTDEERERYGCREEAMGSLDAPMFLLAIVTGIPTLAPKFIAMIHVNPTVQPIQLLFSLAEWAKREVADVDAVNRIDEFRKSNPEGYWQALSGSQLKPWIARVSQFSFDHLLSAKS